ncbi:hypothetical protein [Calycomorphotria hydatis]|uniref:Uncharacterized protein n=1 Tax=Calycomorphotria hydatis TaxID=2528027 RepID=A0A517T4K7_9PLAN|nr:hypothetical protein [Calycomorphotria hydatis]QDT63281.1 hypothetical protein V22_05000 [Calycomorphotria hydatis]
MPAYTALVFGLFLMAVAGVFIWTHWRTWKRRRDDLTLSDEEFRFHRNQFRRRVQTSGLIFLLGILIPAGDWYFERNKDPFVFAIFWIGILLIVLWIVLLAVGDFVSGRLHLMSALRKIERRREALEEEVANLKRDLQPPERNGH